MKSIILILSLALGATAQAATEKQNYVNGYAVATYGKYAAATQAAKDLDLVIQAFVANPTQEGLELAKQTWVDARKVYGVTEVFRFFDGPIDDADGPEGSINAWPLDEVYIDYVVGKADAGIINNGAEFPEITADVLLGLNEVDGEANISTGWHAIEFLLWGQDLSAAEAGKRKLTDYTTGKNADRRKAYLSTVSTLLVVQLDSVTQEWNPANKNGFATTFVTDADAFTKVVAAAKFLADEELAKERMLVAYETQAQEDEHSCFSDTTSNDIYANFVGIKNVLTENYNGVSFVGLVAAKDAVQAKAITDTLASLEAKFVAFPAVFDQALLDPQGRVQMKAIIDELVVLGEQIGVGLELLK